MARVLVWGCSGSGKSTFARHLARITGLPCVSLDAQFWQPGWVESDRADFRARMAPILASDAWILDGNYLSALDHQQVARGTHIFFFDLPRWRCLAGVIGRVATTYGRVRPEMAAGCPEQFDAKFLRYVWDFQVKQRPRFLTILQSVRPDQRVETFRSHRDVAMALERIGRLGLA